MGRHMSVLSLFYRWAIAEDFAEVETFTYGRRGRCSPVLAGKYG
jgi:hypothetical protein